MSYKVLARKWRPQVFSELVGQEHVVRALSNALDNDRVHHAYLFTGTRGVGKTTLARILAKSLNCETGVTSQPCGECNSCREIDEGRFVDLIEVDAASRTKVDQTRELLENVPYAPVAGRYKVYLIDEVHMFSDSSFNALLKTLEEPPPHVKFLLATTDPQKVPVTVLSRCLQFNLKRLPLDQIQGQLKKILDSEKIFSDPAALQLLSLAADGSMRDALSLLDQAIVFGGGQVREQDIRSMLGTVPLDFINHILSALSDNDAQALMQHVDSMAQQSVNFTELLKTLLTWLHRIALMQMTAVSDVDESPQFQRIAELSQILSAEDVQLYYQMALVGQNDLNLAPDPRIGFEMLMLRMLAFQLDNDAGGSDQTRRPKPSARPGASPPPARKPQATPQHNSAVPAAEQPATAPAGAPPPADINSRDWPDVIARLNLKGLTGQFAGHCAVQSWDDTRLVLALDPQQLALRSSTAESKLCKILSETFSGVKVEIVLGASADDTPQQLRELQKQQKQSSAVDDIHNDPYVHEMQQRFGAEVVDESIKPVSS